MDGFVPAALGPLGQPPEAWPHRETTEGTQDSRAEQRPSAVYQGSQLTTAPDEASGPPPLPQTYLRFTVDEWGQVHVKVVDASNDEVIREIPPAEASRVAAAIRAYQQEHLQRGSGQE